MLTQEKQMQFGCNNELKQVLTCMKQRLRTIAETAKKNADYFESSLAKLVAAQSISGRCD